MDPRYAIQDTSTILSPGLVVFRELVEKNLQQIIAIAGDPRRLRPHCKTHKMPDVIALQLERGITKHKCATLAEAEMLATAGVRDIFLAYNLVGPNIERAVQFVTKFPDVALAVTADHPGPVEKLGAAMQQRGLSIGVLLDIDSGQHRTGLAPGPQAVDLYRRIAQTPGLIATGLHLYDGQNHQTSLDERTAAVGEVWRMACRLRDDLQAAGLNVPRIVAGGTGSFPIFAREQDPALELSPGTVIFHDAGYSQLFPDLEFVPAALLLTRVISRPTATRITLDLGYKAVASDPPAGRRLIFPDLPDAKEVLHNEEHLVLETERAGDYRPGDELLAIPRHVCPTSALHRQAWVVSHGAVTGTWNVTARDRQITI